MSAVFEMEDAVLKHSSNAQENLQSWVIVVGVESNVVHPPHELASSVVTAGHGKIECCSRLLDRHDEFGNSDIKLLVVAVQGEQVTRSVNITGCVWLHAGVCIFIVDCCRRLVVQTVVQTASSLSGRSKSRYASVSGRFHSTCSNETYMVPL